jgi:hypothetical protein
MKKFSTFSGKLEGNPRGSLFKLDPPEAALQKKTTFIRFQKVYCRYWVNVTFKLVYLKLAMALTG